jgi:NAD+ kinase
MLQTNHTPWDKTPQIQKVGIIAKHRKTTPADSIKGLIQWLEEREIETLLDSDSAALINTESPYLKSEVPGMVDLVIVLGGDGTLLSVARLVEGKNIPILGVNLGGLGFLTEITLEELYPFLEKILTGDYQVSERMLLNTHIHRQGERVTQYPVLNDVVINKGALARIIELEVFIDKAYVNTFRADGLIVSTPTGSTAYSLAAGGPIIHPTLDVLIINPICPHMLSNRPIVVPADTKIEVILKSEMEDVHVTLDGQVGFALRYRDIVEIRKAPNKIRLIRSPSRDYYQIWRTKLKWGER